MSEPKRPFDAAIKNLRMTVVQIKQMFPEGNSVTESHETAIRVLEVAGKVADRRDEILGALYTIPPNKDGNINLVCNLTRGIIEALPGKEKK
jgi:hypothetical protein